MGLYYGYYLCYGTFDTENEATVQEQIEVDVSIDQAEWRAGIVPLAEIEERAPRWNIRIVPAPKDIQDDTVDVDLFMKESMASTLDVPPSTSHRYILVKRDTMFEYTTANKEDAGAKGSCI
jgi:hypothetical protein